MRSRPLLDRLPLQVGKVRIFVAGLSQSGEFAQITIDSGGRSSAQARAVYRDALAAFSDDGRQYRVKVAGQ